VPASLCVERLGRHVEAVGPDDRAELFVDTDFSEPRRVVQRFEDATPLVVVERDVAHGAVLEREAQFVRADDFDVR